MKKYFVVILATIFTFPVVAQQRVKPQNTQKIELGESKEMIIRKAANVVPGANQLNALRNEYIAFIHFGPNTFTRMEWGSGMEDPKIFDLKTLDTDQWCAAMKAGGMKMVILTVKHHDGFVLWQSRYTRHGIMSTGFQEGKGDILKDLSASCKKFGLKLGIYLSPADLYQIESPDGLYGNLSKKTKRTIPREIPGRPFQNNSKFEFVVDDYNEYFLNQLFEVLTEYGEVYELWFDGAHPKQKGGQQYDYAAWKKLIKTLAPKAVVFGREDIRWCGNESGATRKTEWNVIPFPINPDTTSNYPDMTDMDLGSREKLYNANYLHYQQAETNTSIREGWFYRDDTHQKVRSADDVFDIYERSVGGNSTFLLNIPPNREGKFSPADVACLDEVGKRIAETYGTNLLAKAKGTKQVLDNNPNSFVLLKENKRELLISLPVASTINRVMLQEAIATHGERVESHAVDAWIDGNWKEIARATNIGYKRILRFPEVTSSKLRIRVLESRLDPAISHVSAHYYQSRPPQLTFKRDVNGFVTIAPAQSDFAWKPSGENAAENLNTGYTIFYTMDGTEPTNEANRYEKPFFVEAKELKAISYMNAMGGAVESRQFGWVKKDWKLLNVSSERKNRNGTLAFDANPKTYWQSTDSDDPHFIALDLGAVRVINGLVYTPQTSNSEGMMAKAIFQISDDGINWLTVENFEFGNLINDPTPRSFRFANAVNTRYVRIQATEIAANGKSLSIAELDFI